MTYLWSVFPNPWLALPGDELELHCSVVQP